MTEAVEAFRSGLLNWAYDNLRSFSWSDTDFPYEILVAEILLQNTAAEKVEPIYDKLMAAYPTLDALADADQENLADLTYSLGLQNQRSKALITIGLCPASINRRAPRRLSYESAVKRFHKS